MPGTAILDPDILVDDLVADIDELRQELPPGFGVRPFRVFKVVRTWSDGAVGEGEASDVATEILPPPVVEGWDGVRWVSNYCGLETKGRVRLLEVSLSYTYPELVSGVAEGAEVLYRLDEAYGQLQPSRWFTLAAQPYPDRERGIGWVIALQAGGGAA